jgi:hypothetical protein
MNFIHASMKTYLLLSILLKYILFTFVFYWLNFDNFVFIAQLIIYF